MQRLSEEICFIMDNVGYGDEMRRFRIQEYDKRNNTYVSCGLTCYNTGSKAEGLSLPFQGDKDIMCVSNNSVCVDDPNVSGDLNILRAEYNDMAPPGYVHVIAFQLPISSLTDLEAVIANSILYTNESGQKLVSSSFFRNILTERLSSVSYSHYDIDTSSTTTGPAFTTFISTHWFSNQALEMPSLDFVHADYFYTSKYRDHWKQRPRYHDWPSSAMLEDIAQSEEYIVPVGSAESNFPDLEWRVSYVTAEQKLMRNLNSTQAKLYVVLKMISKELLCSEGSGISSYVIKNVVLWVCELYGKEMFFPALMLDQIATALLFLKLCLQNNHVPNYIIPERNLIAGRLNVQYKTNLIDRLSDLVKNPTYIFHELNIFRKYFHILHTPPYCIKSYGQKRDTIEKLLLQLVTVFCEHQQQLVMKRSASGLTDIEFESYKDERWVEKALRLLNLVVPE